MQNKFLAADPLHQYLVLSERIRRGSTFETKDLGFPLRSKDFRFRPVYLTNAPDGSIYVADFYEHFIAHGQHYQSQIDPRTGRIYRLRSKEAKLKLDFWEIYLPKALNTTIGAGVYDKLIQLKKELGELAS